MSEKLYKVLKGDKPIYGVGRWSLPHDGQPGEWMPPIQGELIECSNGYHLCRKEDLVFWLGPDIYEAEARGEILKGGDKIVVREARLLRRLDAWNERTARLLACDYAEHVLYCVTDPRPAATIAVARRFANGQATLQELEAARAATWVAAWDAGAAEATARAAARAAAGDAAGAAWDAAEAAARAAARAAAWAIEREWQTQRLFEYLL